MKEHTITSINQLLESIKNDTNDWTKTEIAKPWYRGHTDSNYTLTPSILRNGNEIHEFPLTTRFRLVAPAFDTTPPTSRLDQWLFLMQHFELPTRLLDWTENPLFAALFATRRVMDKKSEIFDASIFAIDPIALNNESGLSVFENTWIQGRTLQTIKYAFGTQEEPVYLNGKWLTIKYFDYPTAIYPSYIHSRIRSQKGCFTLHGSDKRPIENIFINHPLIQEDKLIRYTIPKNKVIDIHNELIEYGITYSVLFQDLGGLSKELKYQFNIT